MILNQQRPWWAQQPAGMPPPPGTESDPTQPPVQLSSPTPLSRFDPPPEPEPRPMPDEPQLAPQQPVQVASNWMPPPPGATPEPAAAPTPVPEPTPAATPAPVAPPAAEPDPNAIGRDPVRRARMIGALEGADDRAMATAPPPEDPRIAADKEVMAEIIKQARQKTPAWRQALAAALTISPRTAGISPMVLHPPNNMERLAPVINKGAEQAVREKKEADEARLRQEQIETTKEWRLAAIDQRAAAQKGAPLTPADRLAMLNAHPEVKVLFTTEHELMEYVINGTIKEKGGPTIVPQGSAVIGPDGKVTIPNPSQPKLTTVAPGGSLVDPAHPEKPVFTAPAKEVADKEDPNHWIAIANDPTRPQAERDQANANLKLHTNTVLAGRPVTNNQFTIPGLGKQTPEQQNLTGEEYLKTLPPATAATLRQMAAGKLTAPSPNSRQQSAQQLRQALMQYDPQFSEQRARIRNAFLASKDGSNIGALNTAVVHMGRLGDAFGSLNNGRFTPANEAWNWVKDKFGVAATTNFDLLKSAVAGEMATALKGNATDQEIAHMGESIRKANSPDQMYGVVQEGMAILNDKMNTFDERFHAQLPDDPWSPVLPSARAMLQRHGVINTPGQNPAPLAGASAQQGGYKPGETRNIGGVNYVRDDKGNWHSK